MRSKRHTDSIVTIGLVTAILVLAGAFIQFLSVVLPLLFKKI